MQLNKFQRFVVSQSDHKLVTDVQGVIRFEKTLDAPIDWNRVSLDEQTGILTTDQAMNLYRQSGSSLQQFIDRFTTELNARVRTAKKHNIWGSI